MISSSGKGSSSMSSVVGELRVASMPVSALSLSLPLPSTGLRQGRVPTGMPLYTADFVRCLSFPAPLLHRVWTNPPFCTQCLTCHGGGLSCTRDVTARMTLLLFRYSF
jgi:hypothetical protein